MNTSTLAASARPYYAVDSGEGLWCTDRLGGDGTSLASESARKGTVLVVDDEVLIADSLAKILNRSGFQAEPFYSGADALQRLQLFCPDVLLADVVMPLMNGIELAVEVRRRCPGTRVLLFSGQAATSDMLDRARDEGYQFELLPKPIHPDQLLKRLMT